MYVKEQSCVMHVVVCVQINGSSIDAIGCVPVSL